uniref:C2H2-type domain-containing protein n=1 Tax=Oryza meridionalis TaxID=40149 RepID=A0A0E0EDU1_9ORYZ
METDGMINMPCLDGLISNKNRSETDAYVFLKLLASSSGGNNIMGPHDSPARCVEYSYSPTCRYGTFATGGCDKFYEPLGWRKQKPSVPPLSPTPVDFRAHQVFPSKHHDFDASKSRNISGSVAIGSDSEEEYLATSLLMLAHGIRDETEDIRGMGDVKGVGVDTLELVKPSQRGYECSVCGKVYWCYQALGGHMTCHRNLFAQVVAGDELSSDGTMVVKGHKCSICRLEFPSGQALGGHMRVHYVGGVEGGSVKEKNVVKTKVTGALKPMLKDFDLNVPVVATMVGDEAESSHSEAKRARMMTLP